MMNAKYEYLIVGGTTKSATTSLFFYLKDHPEICSSSIKETRYWLEKSYPVRAHFQYSGDNEFDHFFEHCSGGVKMEATPDYLHSQSAPYNLQKELSKHFKIIFVLRDPVDRLVSWFKYSKQNGFLNEEVSFSDYVKTMAGMESEEIDQQHMLALRQGKYIDYLDNWFQEFDTNQISIYFFEDLKRDPVGFMTSLCDDVGINPDFFQNYKFEISNNSLNLKSGRIHKIYKLIRYKVRVRSHRYRSLHKLLQLLKRGFDPIYLRLNARKEDNTPKIEKATLNYLKDYYRLSNDKLNSLIDDKNLSDTWHYYDCSD